MSAKPYHRGHHALVQIAALGSASDAALEGAPDNDVVIVFVSYSSRGTKPGTKASGGKERVTPGETPVFGDDMKYIWEELLLPNLELPSNVIVRSPSTGAPASPILGVRNILSAVHNAKLAGETSVKIPFTDITVDPDDVELTIYSDDVDIDENYPDEVMERQYPGSLGTLIKKFGVPRSATVEISGTKMRDLLCKGDKAAFIPMLPDLPSSVADQIFDVLSTSAVKMCPRKDWSSTTESLIRSITKTIAQEQVSNGALTMDKLQEKNLRSIVRAVISEVQMKRGPPGDILGDECLHALERIEQRIDNNCSFYSMIPDAVESSTMAQKLWFAAQQEHIPLEEYKKILEKMKRKFPNFENGAQMSSEHGPFAYYLSRFFKPNNYGTWGRGIYGPKEWYNASRELKVTYSPTYHSCVPGPAKDTEIAPRKGGSVSSTSTDWSDMDNPKLMIRDRKTGKLVPRELTPKEKEEWGSDY